MLAFDTVEAVQKELGSAGYIASDGLAVSLFLALAKQRALFLEGEAGVENRDCQNACSCA